MKKGAASGPQKPEREPEIVRRDDRQRARVAYGAVRIRLIEDAERLLQAVQDLPPQDNVAKVEELPTKLLQGLEADLGKLRIAADQLRDGVM